MITCKVCLACVLLIGAVSLVRGFQAAQNAPLGFRPDHLLTGWINLPDQKYRDHVQAGIFFDRLLENIRRLPGVVGAGMNDSPPFSFHQEAYYTPFAIVGRPIPDSGEAPE